LSGRDRLYRTHSHHRPDRDRYVKKDEEKSQQAGSDAYIDRPLRHAEIYVAIDALLGSSDV
jgi:hypothetical protein